MTEISDAAVLLPSWVEYVSALAPALAVLAAAVAAAIAFVNYLRQQKTDREAKFWRRLEWAIPMSSSEDLVDANMGMSVLTAMATDETLAVDDGDLLDVLSEEVLNKVSSNAYAPPVRAGDGGES
ncbi:MAG: hypothetical protein ACTHYJ_09805 [Brevibacterium yomogidense]|nr:hypothetical protein [Brevibacterium sp. Mu109]SMX93373.1 hypothetical protein BSP109_02705 [Brevibacterium sp. Mu109]